MDELKERLKQHLSVTRKSQNQIARSIGVSSGVISSWLSDSYKGDNRKLSHSIKAYLRKEENRQRRLHIPTVEIDCYRKIRLAMDTAAEETDIALICGHAGTGKTTALIDYVNRYGGIYIKADKTITQHTLTLLLANKLSIGGPVIQLTEKIIHTLEDLDTLIVIDEADYLSDGALEYLRQVVYDAGHTGLVLCGLPRLEAAIQNIRNDHDQLLTRIGVRLMLEDISDSDMESVIDAAWPALKTPIKKALISASAIRFRSEPSACLRTLEKILKRLHLYTHSRDAQPNPTIEDVKEVAKLVMRRH